MLSVTCPNRMYCSHAQEMLINTHPMIPGRISLKVLMSQEVPGNVGLSGRPRKNCDQRYPLVRAVRHG